MILRTGQAILRCSDTFSNNKDKDFVSFMEHKTNIH